MKATIKFPSYEKAKAFARMWAHYSFRGYNMSSDKGNQSTVTLFEITPTDKEWIDSKTVELNQKELRR